MSPDARYAEALETLARAETSHAGRFKKGLDELGQRGHRGFDPVHAGHEQVEQDDVEQPGPRLFDRLGA